MFHARLRMLPAALFVSGALAIPASAQGTATLTTLDSSGNVGRDSAVAYGPSGLALVSYLDATNGNLKVAACQNVACTSAVVQTIDPSGTVGGSTSITFGPDGRALIGYQDQATSSVKVAHCSDATCASASRFTVDDLTALRPGTAIGVGADGLGVVAYGDATSGLLKMAHCNDADCSTSTVTSYPGRGSFNPSLTIGGDGLALFSADDGVSLDIGHCSNAACTTATFTTIVGTAVPPNLNKFFNGSLARGANGFGVIALTNEQVTLAGGQGDVTQVRRCLDVTCSSIQGNNQVAANFFSPALAILPGDRPLVAHYGGIPTPFRLQVTNCPGAVCGGLPEPPTYPIEVPGIGQEPALAVSPEDIGLVSYYDDGNADLKVAYLQAGPELSIDDVTIVEGNSGLTPAVFTVRLASPASATVEYAAQGNSATLGVDFLAASGTLTFTPGSLTQTVTVSVVGDLGVELDEFFTLALSNAQNATIVDAEAVGLIVDDDVALLPVSGELEHGSVYFGDLAAEPGPSADLDYFRIRQDAFASYEVVADGISGDAVPLDLRLANSDGLGSAQSGTATGTGSSVTMAWQVPFDTPVLNQLVRVSASCGTSCGADDVYRLRAYETTLSGARFNNAGSQTTVLLLQNPGSTPVSVTIRFWSSTGALLRSHVPGAPIAPRGLLVLNTAQVPGVTGQSGSVTVAHDGGYDGLIGKAVALEPSTGFSFDTPLTPRPR